MAIDLQSSELENKFLKERVNSVEKHFADLSSKLSSYVKKLTHLKDSGDEVAKCLSAFASKETYNQTLSLSMGEFSDILFSIQGYREALINHTQVKVIHELDNYRPICKQAKVTIKKCFDAREKELKRKVDLEKLRSKDPPNLQKISQAEKEVSKAQIEAAQSTQELSQEVEHFERKKIEDLKKLFLELVKFEMIFHCKAIELYTKSYNILLGINVDEDLNEFKSHFKGCHSTLDMALTLPPSQSLDMAVTSPPNQSLETVPKVIDEPEDISSYTPQVLKGAQGRKSRSIFTLKN